LSVHLPLLLLSKWPFVWQNPLSVKNAAPVDHRGGGGAAVVDQRERPAAAPAAPATAAEDGTPSPGKARSLPALPIASLPSPALWRAADVSPTNRGRPLGPRQVRESPRTLSGEQTRIVPIVHTRPIQHAAGSPGPGSAVSAERAPPASPHLAASPLLSPHGATEYCSDVGGSALDGSIVDGSASALAFAAETPVVPLRQGRGPAGGSGASTPFFTPGVASTASVARRFQQPAILRSLSSGAAPENQIPAQVQEPPSQQLLQQPSEQPPPPPPQPQPQSQPQAEEAQAAATSPARSAPGEHAEVQPPAMVDMSPQRSAPSAVAVPSSGGSDSNSGALQPTIHPGAASYFFHVLHFVH
jgi:hypothetical protein